jgi:hypothetical protein
MHLHTMQGGQMLKKGLLRGIGVVHETLPQPVSGAGAGRIAVLEY